ncbi:hypothetical protein BSR29_05380 [Boudabousia liubingyangii]|uniref:Uncharacterized protein n=1 Tax=Boudabousia liubingyangii TaxID=1921764 RepID=A0A1Q5PLM2_9ACTO|nr:hypothetical protein [Boudabousia liubingyangii]OKL47030.1 hypothetical protein BSR28_06345 [Boudabousia liubingyangii]OKL47917.1 hypothetical protein BSR29_05380 [Boudabousia liubingyangii]
MKPATQKFSALLVPLGIIGLVLYGLFFAEIIQPTSIWIDITLLALTGAAAVIYLLLSKKHNIRAISITVLSVIGVAAMMYILLQPSGNGADVGMGAVAMISSVLAYLVAATYLVPDRKA